MAGAVKILGRKKVQTRKVTGKVLLIQSTEVVCLRIDFKINTYEGDQIDT